MNLQKQNTPIEKGTIKVLHLIDSGGLYGAEKMLLTLVAEQIKQGLEPMILSAGEKGIEDKAIEVEARKLRMPIESWRMAPGFNLKESWKILKWAKSNNFNVLHSHGYKFNILMAIVPKKFRGMPVIATLHGYVNGHLLSKIWFYELLDQILLKRLDRVCLVSPHMTQLSVISTLPEKMIEVVENGLSTPVHSARKAPELTIMNFLAKFSFNLLAVGRLSPEKNLSSLIKALSSGELKNESVGLCIIGEGRLEQSLRQQSISLGLGERVFFLGYRTDVVELMKHFDLLVMPSLTEGLPITLLEAMREGLPVLASSVGGIPNALDNGSSGQLFDPHALNQLEAKILQSIRDERTRFNLMKMAQKRFSNIFSAASMAQSYERIYKELIVGSKADRCSTKGVSE
ncbi:glycosyltransferase [Marinobacter sp. 1Y8]